MLLTSREVDSAWLMYQRENRLPRYTRNWCHLDSVCSSSGQVPGLSSVFSNFLVWESQHSSGGSPKAVSVVVSGIAEACLEALKESVIYKYSYSYWNIVSQILMYSMGKLFFFCVLRYKKGVHKVGNFLSRVSDCTCDVHVSCHIRGHQRTTCKNFLSFHLVSCSAGSTFTHRAIFPALQQASFRASLPPVKEYPIPRLL